MGPSSLFSFFIIISLHYYHSARQAPVKFMFRQRGYLKIALDSNDMEDLFNTAESTKCAFDFDEWEDDSSRGIEVCIRILFLRIEPIES